MLLFVLQPFRAVIPPTNQSGYNIKNSIKLLIQFSQISHLRNPKIPKIGIFGTENSQFCQTPFPKIGRKSLTGIMIGNEIT